MHFKLSVGENVLFFNKHAGAQKMFDRPHTEPHTTIAFGLRAHLKEPRNWFCYVLRRAQGHAGQSLYTHLLLAERKCEAFKSKAGAADGEVKRVRLKEVPNIKGIDRTEHVNR